MRGAVVDGQYIDWKGFRINICCGMCDQLFREDPEKFIEILSEDTNISPETIEEMYRRSNCEGMDDCEDMDMDSCEDMDMDNCEDMDMDDCEDMDMDSCEDRMPPDEDENSSSGSCH